MRRASVARSALLLASLLVTHPALGWGDAAHRWFARNATRALPRTSCLRSWVEQHADAFYADRALDPDRWRDPSSPNFNPDEGPLHYLDVDAAEPPASYPREWAAVVARFGEAAAKKQGRVPWHVERTQQALTAAFRAKDEKAALLQIALLSHYVSDAFSPHHSTLNFNPKLSAEDKEGLHTRYEGRLFEDSRRLGWVTSRALLHLPRMEMNARAREAIFAALMRGLGYAARLNREDVASRGDVEQLYERTREWSAELFAQVVSLLGALIAQAHEAAGAPALRCSPSAH